jgi:hypothetical protein
MVVTCALLVPVPQAAAQARPAMVRSVDEPARVPYFYSLAPTCPFLNVCQATFPAVPTGKRLRLTSVSMLFRFTDVSGFLAINLDARSNLLAMFPVSPINGAYYGTTVAATEQVDLYFEEGQAPVLEFGVPAFSAGISVLDTNRFLASGYLVDVSP